MSNDTIPIVTLNPDFNRDGFGRPLIIPIGGGRPVAYTRCTTYIDCLEDKYKLQQWEKRMVGIGLSTRPDLLLAVSAHRDDRDKLDRIMADAKEAALANAAATTGTALHALTERIDRGQDIGVVPEAYLADLAAYQEATDPLMSVMIEQKMVLDALKVAGTPDRVVRLDGKFYIADVKTGSISYGIGKIAMQLAVYARSQTYDLSTGERGHHPAEKDRGIIIHLPAGEGVCTLWWVDLMAGWEGVGEARRVREYRRRRFNDLTEPFIAPPVGPNIPMMIGQAQTVDELTAVWRRYESVWKDEYTALAKDARAAIEKDIELGRAG